MMLGPRTCRRPTSPGRHALPSSPARRCSMPADHVPGGPQHATMRVPHGHHDDGLRHAVPLQQRHAGGVEELVHRVRQRAAADAGKAQTAAEPGAHLAKDEAVGERVEGASAAASASARRSPAVRRSRPRRRRLWLAARQTPPRRRRRERAGHQPAHEPSAPRPQGVDPVEDALVQLDPQLRHGGHDYRAHRRQVAAQVS